jgi:hypothetical protein
MHPLTLSTLSLFVTIHKHLLNHENTLNTSFDLCWELNIFKEGNQDFISQTYVQFCLGSWLHMKQLISLQRNTVIVCALFTQKPLPHDDACFELAFMLVTWLTWRWRCMTERMKSATRQPEKQRTLPVRKSPTAALFALCILNPCKQQWTVLHSVNVKSCHYSSPEYLTCKVHVDSGSGV